MTQPKGTTGCARAGPAPATSPRITQPMPNSTSQIVPGTAIRPAVERSSHSPPRAVPPAATASAAPRYASASVTGVTLATSGKEDAPRFEGRDRVGVHPADQTLGHPDVESLGQVRTPIRLRIRRYRRPSGLPHRWSPILQPPRFWCNHCGLRRSGVSMGRTPRWRFRFDSDLESVTQRHGTIASGRERP